MAPVSYRHLESTSADSAQPWTPVCRGVCLGSNYQLLHTTSGGDPNAPLSPLLHGHFLSLDTCGVLWRRRRPQWPGAVGSRSAAPVASAPSGAPRASVTYLPIPIPMRCRGAWRVEADASRSRRQSIAAGNAWRPPRGRGDPRGGGWGVAGVGGGGGTGALAQTRRGAVETGECCAADAVARVLASDAST